MSEDSQKAREQRGDSSPQDRQQGGDSLKALIPLLTDLIPLFLEKWSDVHQRPSLRDLEERQSRMGRRIKKIAGQLNWHRIFFAGLLIWNIILTALHVIK
ncbi:MAG: hypothetical protein RIF32_14770 [Leptospirales bacterium]|jgi:hypothetical protein